MSQVCWPGQTIRINTGWNISKLPDNSMMNTYPDATLMSYDIIGFTNIFDKEINEGG